MAVSKIQSSTYNPIYPTNPETGNLLVENVGTGGTGGLSTTIPVVRTPGLLITSTSGTITAGATSIAIANSGASSGIVLDVLFASGISVSWNAPANDRLASVSYDATGTTFIITEVR